MREAQGHRVQSQNQHSHAEPAIAISEEREVTKVLLLSLGVMLATATVQAWIVARSGSIGLLADTIHNFGDALTSLPLWLAFWLSQRPPTKRFSYGLNRSEDLAGLLIVTVIAISAVVVGYQSALHIVHRTEPTHLWSVAVGALVGFAGNEVAALIRIRMGQKMGSAALVADGRHARIDGISSLAVLFGVVGVWLGYPFVDPLVGLVITVLIVGIVKDSATQVFTRLLDGIEPDVIDRIQAETEQVDGVCRVTSVRARWFGHQIRAELRIAMDGQFSVQKSHSIAETIATNLQGQIEHLADVDVHVDPCEVVQRDAAHRSPGDQSLWWV